MRIGERLRGVWRSRGPLGFARFVASRVVAHRRDVVFAAQTADAGECEPPGGAFAVLCIDRDNVNDVVAGATVAQLARGEGRAYVEGLHELDLVVVVVDATGDVLHHSFVLFDTRTKRLLGEEPSTPLFANCVTRDAARGNRLYPRALRHGLRLLAQRGHRRAIINCDPANAASIRGIERAGFRRVRELETWIVASFIGLQRVRDGDGHARWRWYAG